MAWGGGNLAWGLLSHILGFSPLPLKYWPHFPPRVSLEGVEDRKMGDRALKVSLGFPGYWLHCPLLGTVPNVAPLQLAGAVTPASLPEFGLCFDLEVW